MIVCYACTRELYDKMPTAVNSLLTNNKNATVYIICEDDSIDGCHGKNINFINIKNHELPLYVSSPNCGTSFSIMEFYRLLIPELIKEDKVLYLDADTIVDDSLEDLFNLNINNYYCAAVRETFDREVHVTAEYINSGVMLYNNKKIIEDNLIQKAFDLLNKNYYFYPNQDVISILCENKIKYIDSGYNYSPVFIKEEPKKIYIRHFCWYEKPWLDKKGFQPIYEKYRVNHTGIVASIILPVYNRENKVLKALESIPYRKDIEVIAIDDGSTDNTLEILKKHKRNNYKIIHITENKGVGFARNVGLNAATGDWIISLDSDDYFTPNVNKVFNNIYNYMSYDMIKAKWQEEGPVTCAPWSYFIKRSILKDIGYPNIRAAEDYFLLKKLEKLNLKSIEINDIFYHYSGSDKIDGLDYNHRISKTIKVDDKEVENYLK